MTILPREGVQILHLQHQETANAHFKSLETPTIQNLLAVNSLSSRFELAINPPV